MSRQKTPDKAAKNVKFKEKLNLDKLLENRNFLRIFSVVAAILCWLMVAFAISPIIEDTKREVPVNIEGHSSTLAALGLNIIEVSTETVSANVRGSRSVVGGLQAEDLTATVRISNVTEPNVYDLELIPLSTPDGYEIISYSPSRIQVRLDRLVSQTFDVVPLTSGLATAEDYTFDKEYVSPERITVTGPQNELDKISRCVVRADLGSPLDRTYSEMLPIILEDVQGNEMDLEDSHLMLDHEEAQLVVRVLKNRDLALDIEFINIPRDFNYEELQYTMSNTGVLVAAPEDVIDRYRELIVGVISIKELRPGRSSYVFDVELPTAEFVNLENINSITVAFDTSGWGEETFNIDDILLLNPPSQYNVSLLNQNAPLNNITFVGDREMLELMTADDIVAEIDLSDKDYQPGQYTAAVKLSAPTRGMVWAVGDYNVVIKVEEKS